METYSAWEWLQRRFGYGVGQRFADASAVIPAPVWFEEGDHPGIGMRWYGVVFTYPRRPGIEQLGPLPPGVRPVIGFADDILSARNPGDLVAATDKVWVHLLQQFGRGGGSVVMPAFYGRDP